MQLETVQDDDAFDPRALRPAQAAGLSDATLEEINRLWTIVRVFSNTAHDINNALQVIGGSTELLEALELDPIVKRRVAAIRVENAKAAVTINRLLAYARTSGESVLRLDVWPIVESAISMRLASVSRGRISLTIDGAHDAPVWVAAEPNRLLQALLDLLLVAEDGVLHRANAKIVVSVALDGTWVAIQLAASAGERGVDDAELPVPGALTAAAQLWAAWHLATALGGDVTMSGVAHARTLTLRLPAAPA
jgi:C4-dicarboxylate-specific signal transduction histidine kinase